MNMIRMENHQEAVEELESKLTSIQSEYDYLNEDYEDLKQEYADYRLKTNGYISSLKNILEETIKEDKKIKRDCKIITALSFILVVLVIVLMIL